MKRVGVLGGMGPQATIDFEARFHRAAQRMIPPRFNFNYPPLVVAYVRHPPMLWDDAAMKPILPLRPDPRLIETARSLGPLVDFLIVPSNAPHHFQREIEAASGRRMLSMIALVMDEVKRRGWRRVGVVGLGEPTVYTTPLTALGIACEILPVEVRDAVDQAIGAVMEGRVGPEHGATASHAVADLRARSVEGSILGCSEIPLLLGERSEAPDLLNPLELLAQAAVRAALGEIPI